MKYKEELSITFLALISLYGIFVTSNEPILSVLQGTSIEPFFCNSLSGNEALFNIASGFFVSTVFYVMVVYVPEKRREVTIQFVVKRLIEDVIRKGEDVIFTIEQHAPKDLKFMKNNDFSLNTLKQACEAIETNQLIDLSKTLPANINCTVGIQLHNRENIAKQSRLKLLAYLQYVDEQLVQEVDNLDSSRCSVLAHSGAIPNFSPENLGFLGEPIFEYHQHLGTIARIYKKKLNQNYSNKRYSL